jgi:hypothetical protein
MALDIKVGDGIATVAVGDALITLWRLPAAPQRVKWLSDRLTELSRALPGDMIHLMLVLSTSSPPGAEGRALFQKQLAELDRNKKLRKFVVVALGDSFWINIVRAMGRTIVFLAGRSHLLTLVDSLDKGLACVREHHGPGTAPSADLAKAAYQLAHALGVDVTVVPGFTSTSAAP